MIRIDSLRKILLSFLVLALGAANAFAGYYSVRYSGSGVVTINWISGGQSTTSAYLAADLGGGTVAPTGSVNCQGSITATLTWVPENAIDTPPAFILVNQAVDAIWFGDSGHCADGMQDAEVDSTSLILGLGPLTGASVGSHWSIIHNPGNSVTLTVSPTAYGYGSAPSLLASNDELEGMSTPSDLQQQGGTGGGGGGFGIPGGRVSAYVSYTVTTWTPNLAFSNVTVPPDGSWNIQVGQPTSGVLYWEDWNGSVTALPHAITAHYSWSVPGVTFASWNTSLSQATVTPVSWLDAPTQSWVWADGSGISADGAFNVAPSVDVQMTANGLSIGDGAATHSISVWRPFVGPLRTVLRDSEYDVFPSPANVSVDATLIWDIGVSDIFGVSSPNVGAGYVNWCQLVDMDDIAWYGFSKEDNTSGQYLVDVNGASHDWYWIIDSSGNPDNSPCVVNQTWNTPVGSDSFSDTPAWQLRYLGIEALGWSVDYDFQNWMMYIPSGNGTVWVPLLRSTWSWISADTTPFTNPPVGSAILDLSGRYNEFPTWAGNHNSH